MNNNYRPTIDEALESVEKLDSIVDMLDYGGALSTDEVDEACVALTTIKLYIQSSVPREKINLKENNYGKQGLYC